MRRQAALALAVLAGFYLTGTAGAVAGGPIERRIQDLFWAISAFVAVVAVIVYGSLIWFLIRYRRSVSPEPTSHSEGSKRIEIVWSIFPTVILIIITLISVPVLYYTDIPPDPDTTIIVTAQQFSWSFTYEDGTTTDRALWIQEDIAVYLKVTSLDVIHSFAVPQLGVKIDAVPGRVNEWWMTADTPGDYLNQCAEFCGVGHYDMRAVVHVFPAGSQQKIYGPPPIPPTVYDVELLEGSGRWSIAVRPTSDPNAPSNITASLGSFFRLRVWNNNSNPHDFLIEAPVNTPAVNIPSFEMRLIDVTLVNASLTPVPYGPSDQSARDQGMIGYLTIQSGKVILVTLSDDGQGRFFIGPPIRLNLSETVIFEIVNTGTMLHNFKIGPPYMDYPEAELKTPLLERGDRTFLGPFTFRTPVRTQYWCEPHRGLGMITDFQVGSPPKESAVPAFNMMAITFSVAIPTTFAYVLHHARRRDD